MPAGAVAADSAAASVAVASAAATAVAAATATAAMATAGSALALASAVMAVTTAAGWAMPGTAPFITDPRLPFRRILSLSLSQPGSWPLSRSSRWARPADAASHHLRGVWFT